MVRARGSLHRSRPMSAARRTSSTSRSVARIMRIGAARHAQPPERLQLRAPHERPGLLLGARDERAAGAGVPLLLQTQRGGLPHARILIVERGAQRGPRVGAPRRPFFEIAELARGQDSAAPESSETACGEASASGRPSPQRAQRHDGAGTQLERTVGAERRRAAPRPPPAAAPASASPPPAGCAPDRPPAPSRRCHRWGARPRSAASTASACTRRGDARGLHDHRPQTRRSAADRRQQRRRRTPSSSSAPRMRAARARSSTEAAGDASSPQSAATGGTAGPSERRRDELLLLVAGARHGGGQRLDDDRALRRRLRAPSAPRPGTPALGRSPPAPPVPSAAPPPRRAPPPAAGAPRNRARSPDRSPAGSTPSGPSASVKIASSRDGGRPVVLGRRRLAAGRDAGDHHRHARRGHRLRQRHPVGVAPVRGVGRRDPRAARRRSAAPAPARARSATA